MNYREKFFDDGLRCSPDGQTTSPTKKQIFQGLPGLFTPGNSKRLFVLICGHETIPAGCCHMGTHLFPWLEQEKEVMAPPFII